ncbi:neuropeptide SIFamide receptor-like [Adelges cooleyi]|uniref:neuropeptide SIFamide receptor-like n=1 Tax=Adelges cooleyi TaxID=133065 RepID=UPI00217F914E|nr:neuropeptide SIFamide receptor-like [Adelges cooleyi]
MHNVTNYLIANLAVADLSVTVFVLPLHLLSGNRISIVKNIPSWACKMISFVSCLSLTASCYFLVAVSVERFLVIWYPLKHHHIATGRIRFVIAVVWSVSAVLSVPPALFVGPVPGVGNLSECSEKWPDFLLDKYWFDFSNLLLLRYVFPFGVISLCYAMIWLKVYRRTIPTEIMDAKYELLLQKSKVRAFKLLILIIPFAVSWLPLQIFFVRTKPSSWEKQMLPVAVWLGVSNSCVNPVLYAMFSKTFRREFLAIARTCKCWGKLKHEQQQFGTRQRSQQSVSLLNSTHLHSPTSQSDDERSCGQQTKRQIDF